MSYSGSCSCGKVVLAIAGEPLATRQVLVPPLPAHRGRRPDEQRHVSRRGRAHRGHAGVALLRRAQRQHGHAVVLSGMRYARPCVELGAAAEIRGVRLGVLDQPHGLAPKMVIWTDEAPAWAVFDPALEAIRAAAPRLRRCRSRPGAGRCLRRDSRRRAGVESQLRIRIQHQPLPRCARAHRGRTRKAPLSASAGAAASASPTYNPAWRRSDAASPA